jgi:hypothetical protein
MLFLFDGYRSPDPWFGVPLIAVFCPRATVNCDCVCACGRIVAIEEVCDERVEDVSELERAEKWSGRMLDMLEL